MSNKVVPDTPKKQVHPIRSNQEPSVDLFSEKHYSVLEIAKLWGLSQKTIRRLFTGEPGVVEIGFEESRSRRVYKTRRIPESVVQRVHRRLRKPA